MHLVLGLANGGLGIKKLTTLNKVLQGKWIWRFTSENESLWIIAVKYGEDKSCCSCLVLEGNQEWFRDFNHKQLLKVTKAKR